MILPPALVPETNGEGAFRADADEMPPELESAYDPDEVFTFDGTPEDLADALFRERQ